jgi:hypothetical protein
MSWTPPERPIWLQRLLAQADAAGGADKLVSLHGDGLLETAMRDTGLADFGGEAWRAHFDVLVRALEEESDLHLVGRILVRAEILQALRNRLRLAEHWRLQPEVLQREVDAPVFIVGSPRSGTSILHELMAADPATRAPAMWEMQRPFDEPSCAASVDRVVQFWHDLQPEYETMHANSGFLPNECIFMTLHEFLSDHWGGNHVVPSYDAHLRSADHVVAYRYHKRFLQTLQGGAGSCRWLLKAPSHLFQLESLFKVYPDARIVRTHRDPLKTLASSISLMGTLKWMRCNKVDMSAAPARLAYGFAYVYQREIEQRAAGRLPDDRFVDLHFSDLVRDPVAAVEGVYRKLGWALVGEAGERVAAYAAAKPKGSRGSHRYSLEQAGLDTAQERERFAFYMAHYGIEPEGSSAS